MFFMSLFSAVSAEILKSSLTTMERQIQRLENDIEHFPKTDDPQDKFVEKMSISFSFFSLHTALEFMLKFVSEKRIVACEGILCNVFLTAMCVVCVLPGRGKQFKSLGVIGGTQGNLGNESGCLAVRCRSDLPLHSSLGSKTEITPVAIFTALCHCYLSPEGV